MIHLFVQDNVCMLTHFKAFFISNPSRNGGSLRRIWTFFPQGMDYTYPLTVRISPQHHSSSINFELSYVAHCSSYLQELSRSLQISFYVTTLLAEGLYVMLELVSVPIPSSVHDMKAFIANLEDLMPLRAIYKKCIQIDSNVQQFQKEGASLQTLSSFLKSGKDRKRHCSFVFNH
ncbi:uncharacterized protein EV154DRAFT_478573 [Mucor mucedo]|uniref:uncharacterized protein n=1 Tax=Mucor mucedo TaxID=29922 RepID=UPI002220881C|nr:uncharacterized protein EV154DRAFT_478573 [Mucor mucedo]KAI7894327.1 hypothetical protein EV154DRAFT_478573 [Mucor mucedo]